MTHDRVLRRAAALQAAATAYQGHGANRVPGREPLDARILAKHITSLATYFDAWIAVRLPVATFTITADPPRERPTQEGTGMSLTFADTQEVTLHVSAVVDAEGEAVTDTFTWSVDLADVLTLVPSDDSLSCLATPGTASGAATVTATATDGVARTFAIDVTTGPTASFEITADAPVDRPAPAAPSA